MCHKSPAKVLRNVIRITKFLEKKSKSLTKTVLPPVSIAPETKHLSIEALLSVDVPPVKKPLSFSTPTFISIPPIQRSLSRCNQLAVDAVPGLINEDENTISTYIDGFTHKTIFICKLCYCDHFQSTEETKMHIRQVHKIITRSTMNYYFEPRFEDVR